MMKDIEITRHQHRWMFGNGECGVSRIRLSGLRIDHPQAIDATNAQPLIDHLGLGPTTRASFALYNTPDEVERLIAGVARALEVLR